MNSMKRMLLIHHTSFHLKKEKVKKFPHQNLKLVLRVHNYVALFNSNLRSPNFPSYIYLSPPLSSVCRTNGWIIKSRETGIKKSARRRPAEISVVASGTTTLCLPVELKMRMKRRGASWHCSPRVRGKTRPSVGPPP